jgi:NAD(P)-dependent dehydrogenase (short-subunit alcohol dehydrogenase family)
MGGILERASGRLEAGGLLIHRWRAFAAENAGRSTYLRRGSATVAASAERDLHPQAAMTSEQTSPFTGHAGRGYVLIGGAGGIGRALAQRLHAAGARLLITSRGPLAAERAAGLPPHDFDTLDATDFAATERLLSEAAGRLGRLDGVANLAGSILLKPAHLTSPDEFAETIATNLTTAFSVVRAASRVMRRDGGSVVLMSSAAARHGLANHEAIAAAKAGVLGLAQSAAATYAPRQLRVNAVAPGLVDTPLAARITASEPALKASRALHPLGRVGSPDEVASLIAWLLDAEQSWITGQTFGIDGGLSTARSIG